MEKGYIHIYTGNGKGKTTAAFGLAARAICAGKNVAVCQFVKSMKYSETGLLQLLSARQFRQAENRAVRPRVLSNPQTRKSRHRLRTFRTRQMH
jgi:cob(I)alamin adenosyltransferase